MVAPTARDVRLLIANVNGEIRVTGPVCPHAGGPLALGELHQRRVTCPWHGSVFDLDTGVVVEPRRPGDCRPAGLASWGTRSKYWCRSSREHGKLQETGRHSATPVTIGREAW